MLDRLEAERLQAGRAVLRGQEQERQRIAQDLHDEVNQALTAILLRLEATHRRRAPRAAPRAAGDQAARQPGHGRAAAPRASAAADRARRPRADRRAGLAGRGLRPPHRDRRAAFRRHGTLPPLSDEQQLVDLPRHAGEPVQHRPARRGVATSRSSCRSSGARCCRVRDDGRGFEGGLNGASSAAIRARSRPGGLGLSGMRERALLVGGSLAVFSESGRGTTIELTMGGT